MTTITQAKLLKNQPKPLANTTRNRYIKSEITSLTRSGKPRPIESGFRVLTTPLSLIVSGAVGNKRPEKGNTHNRLLADLYLPTPKPLLQVMAIKNARRKSNRYVFVS